MRTIRASPLLMPSLITIIAQNKKVKKQEI
jgi:hypothetical protein